MDYAALAVILRKMTLEQLRDVNRMTCNQINHLHNERQANLMTRFRIGDLIEFVDEKNRRTVRARIDRLNAKSIGCTEVGDLRRPWRVSPSFCRLVGADKIGDDHPARMSPAVRAAL